MNFAKNKITRLLVLCAIPIAIFAMSGCTKKHYTEVYKNNWNIELPSDMVTLFYKTDFDGLAGRGEEIRYRNFSLKSEPSDFILDFSSDKSIEAENHINNLISYADFDVPSNYLPVWDDKYIWKHLYYQLSSLYTNHLYMVYYPQSLILICVEQFN